MIARVASASFGLLAFAVVATTGLLARNPIEVTLSRCILALILFSVVGLVLGASAQAVVNEHARERESKIQKRYEVDRTETDDGANTIETAMDERKANVG